MEDPKKSQTASRNTVRAMFESIRYDGVFWRRAAHYGATRMPQWFRRYSPAAVGMLFYALMKRSRTNVEHNLRLLLDDPGWDVAPRCFARYAQCLTDTLELRSDPSRAFGFDVVNQERAITAIARDKGIIFVTAHTGCWDAAAHQASAFQQRRTTLVMAREDVAHVNDFMQQLRSNPLTDVLFAEGNDPSLGLTLLSRLRNKESIAIQIDRGPRNGRSLTVPFGRAMLSVPEGPFRLAQASGAPIVPLFTYRVGFRSHRLMVEHAVEIPRRASMEEVLEAATRVAAALHGFVREHPDQWFHFDRLEPGPTDISSTKA